MNQFFAHAPVFQSHFIGLLNLRRVQTVVYMPAHDLARVCIGDEAGVHKALLFAGYVGNISHPYLLSPVRWRAALEPIGMPPEAMAAVGGLVIRTQGLYQQTRSTQDIKQTVTTDFDALRPQMSLQQMVQLSPTQARMFDAALFDLPNDLLHLAVDDLLRRQELVMRLAAVAPVLASLAHA